MKEIKQKISLSERLDNFIGIFSPKVALLRKAYREASKISSFSSYRGAEQNRLRDSWIPGGYSADQDLLPELSTLRERSRELNRNDGYASGITYTMVTNVVGTGIRPQSRVDKETLGISDDEAHAFQKQVERIWQKWTPFADAGNRMDFYEIEQVVHRQILENGEVIIIPIMVNVAGRPYMLALDIIESDRLETPTDKRGDKRIRSGVEIGDRGEPIAYYIRKGHPGDMTLRMPNSAEYIRYPAFNENGRPNILHLYWQKRPGQTRGEPFFAPIMTLFKDLSDYMEAELVAARVAACFAAFIEKTDAFAAATGRMDRTNSLGQRIESLEPGMVGYLAPGEKFNQFTPNRPGGTFEPFVERILRSIAAGLNIPYEVIAKDFGRMNYSSARTALLEARRFFMAQQEWLAKRFCQPIWEMLIEEAYLREELMVNNFYENRLDWLRCRWIAPGWQWVDPVNEVKAATESVNMGLSTLADESASQGNDWEEVLEQRERELIKIKEIEQRSGVKIINQNPSANQNGTPQDQITAGAQAN